MSPYKGICGNTFYNNNIIIIIYFKVNIMTKNQNYKLKFQLNFITVLFNILYFN